MTAPKHAWVFQAGALGDHVMVWPLIRSLLRNTTPVTLVTHSSHAALAEWIFGLEAKSEPRAALRTLGIERPTFTALWRDSAAQTSVIHPDASDVLSFIADNESDAGARWLANAQRAFPRATLHVVGAPHSKTRASAWEWGGVRQLGMPTAAQGSGHTVVLYAGAGGADKTWALANWLTLAALLREFADVRLIAGFVEFERWTSDARRTFEQHAGRFVFDTLALADELRTAGIYVGCDTGPTHLAAQLGVSSLALFGPTDPAVWRPVGPRVRVVAPPTCRDMNWLAPNDVLPLVLRETEVGPS